MAARLPRDKRVITDPADLADALVEAFLDGTAEERQHIVDTLGQRAEDQRD
jgi:hypothetical protein